MRPRFTLDVAVVHLVCVVVVGLAWWQLAPELTYSVFDGRAFLFDESEYTLIFGGDATFAMLAVPAGLVCAGVVLLRGHRGVRVPVALALAGALGSLAAWGLGVLLGPGRLDALAAATGDGDVVAGPELNAYASLVVWPIVAVGTALVVSAFTEPERRSAPSVPVSAE